MSYKLKINNSYESEPSSCSVSPVCDNNFPENKNSLDDQQIIIGPNKLSELLKPSSSSSVLDQSTDDIAVEKQEPLNLKKLVTNHNPIGLRKIDKLNNFENEIKNKKIKNKCDASLHKQMYNKNVDNNDDDDNNIEDSPSPGKLIIDEDTLFLSNSKKFHKNNQQEIIIKKHKISTKNVNEILLQQNNHHFENLNERSPDLFDNIDDDSEEVINENVQILTNYENDELINNITTINIENSLIKNIQNSDKEILKRIKLSLSGVPPPPSITISQIDILNAVIENKENIFNFYNEFKTIPKIDTIKEIKTSDKVDDNDDDDDDDDDDDQCKDSISTFNDSLFKPSHSLDEMKNISWPEILNVKQHGLCYNISNVREKIELLCLSVVERYVGVETSSSFQGVPANSRRTSARLRTMMQSPGSRLSHLAKRRAAFSSATLQSTFQKKIPKSIVIDSKKSDNRRKSKIKTPKRKTPGKNKIEDFFLTQKPSTLSSSSVSSSSLSITSKISNTSSSFLSYTMKSNAPATRETSKRALFQSPTSEIIKPNINVPKSIIIKPEIATRVEKSKRALFSPDKQSTYKNSSKANIENELKRKRDNDDDNNSNNSFIGNPYKMLRSDFENLTPRSLKFKSQSFCSSTGTNSINSSFQNVKGKSLFRASSDTVCSNQLTESHRKKLLWAVSQALQTKHIDFSHPKFKQYAAVLARAIKRLFLEFYLNIKNTSTSDTMLRLSKKYVHHAISNMSADDIYLNEKNRLEQEKYNLTIKKLSIGYIGPDDYENKILLKNLNNRKLNNKLPSSMFSDNNSCDSFNLLSQTNYCSQISSSTEFLSQISQDSLLSKNHNNIENFDKLIDCNNGTIKLKDNSELITSTISSSSSSLLSPSLSSSTTLQNNSSSKNNLYGVALRENVDCELRKSAQKNFTGKDMKNTSPFIDNITSYRNNNNNNSMTITTTTAITGSNHKNTSSVVDLNALRAKRQISFDN